MPAMKKLLIVSSVVFAGTGWGVGVVLAVSEVCDDGVDNTGNGLIDCEDDMCAEAPGCQVEVCIDGLDNDGNGFVDCDDCECEGDPACAPPPPCHGCNGTIDCSSPDTSPDCVQACGLPRFLRGDSNGDGKLDIADAVWIVTLLFQRGGTSICEQAADANGDGLVDVSDTAYLIAYRLRGGSAPPAPYPDCSVGLPGDALSCTESSCSG